MIYIWKRLATLASVNTSQYQAEFSIAATGVTNGTTFFSLAKNFLSFSLIEKFFLLAIKSENIEDSWPQGFFLKVEPSGWYEYGLFDDNGRYYFTLDWIFKLTVLIYIKQHPGPEPDLTATLPMDPREYTDAFSPPIVLPSQKRSTG